MSSPGATECPSWKSLIRAGCVPVVTPKSSDCIYLTTSTHERQAVFADFTCARALISELRRAQDEGLADSLAWVVMPDHFHWLLALRQGSLELLMHRVKGRSARGLNQILCRSGPVWQSGFHDHALRHEEDMQAIARYIVANPLRAGLVARIGDYPFWDAVWL